VKFGGEIRTINQIDKRIAEAKKLGFKRIVVPKNNLKGAKMNGEVELVGVDTVDEAINSVIGH